MKGTQTKSRISCLLSAVENLKWQQIIGRILIYRHVFRYIKHARWQSRFNELCWSTNFNFISFPQFFKIFVAFRKFNSICYSYQTLWQ